MGELSHDAGEVEATVARGNDTAEVEGLEPTVDAAPNKGGMGYIEVMTTLGTLASLVAMHGRRDSAPDPKVLKENRRVEQKNIADAAQMDRSMKTLGVPADIHSGTNLDRV